MALQINIVFHKTLHREAYDLPKPIIEKYFRFIAVNDKIEKSIPEDLAALVLKETSIKNSSGALQELGMGENSVLFHFYLNPYLLEGIDLVGFFQYDMKFTELFADHLEIIHRLATKPYLFLLEVQPADRHLKQVFTPDDWARIVFHYNKKYNKSHKLLDIYLSSIPLLNSYLLPKAVFNEMMTFLNEICVMVSSMLRQKGKHDTIAIIFERCNGIFLSLWSTDHKIPWYLLNGISHLSSMKDS